MGLGHQTRKPRGGCAQLCRAGLLAVLLAVLPWSTAAVATQNDRSSRTVGPADTRTWLGRAAEFEEYLAHAEVVSMVPIGTGVTNPQRADLAPGGPIAAFAWKPIRRGIQRGYHESYQAELAAYELDKLLGLRMVPVKVERRLAGVLGAACMWVAPTQSFRELGGMPTPPPGHRAWWNVQLIRAKMFDNLIRNIDPNLGNWLVDPSWNIILIDHSRAFTRGRKMVHRLTRIDPHLWERIRRLDESALTAAVGQWLKPKQIRAVLQRRDRMKREIDMLVAARGESDVFVPYSEPD